MANWRAKLAWLHLVWLVVACAEATANEQPASDAEVQELIAAACDVTTMQGSSCNTFISESVCTGHALDDELHARFLKWSQTYMRNLTTCIRNSTCMSHPDQCIVESFASTVPNLGDQVWARDCVSLREACAEQTGRVPYAEGLCQTLAALNLQTRTEAELCLSLSCEEVAQCLKSNGAFDY